MRCLLPGVAFVVLAFVGCARPDRAAPVAPVPVLVARLDARSTEFPLVGNREVAVSYSVTNRGRRAERLQFPTDQRIELVLRGPDGKTLFLWSEDRIFAATPSDVLLNPGERLEYPVAVPTRDMVAGRTYTAEATLAGIAGTGASAVLRPQ